MRSLVLLGLMLASGCRPTTPALRPSSPAGLQMDVTVRPLREGNPEVVAVAVRQELRGLVDRARRWRVGIVYTGRSGIADRVDSLRVRDALGDVPLAIVNDPVNTSGYTYYRHWVASRPMQAPIVLTYRMRPVARPTGGPQFELYAHAGGISGHGSQLFVLPESLGVADVRLRWDLSDLVAGSRAVSSFGSGETRFRARIDTLVTPFYLAGPIGEYTPPKANTGFEAYWLGRLAFDPHKEMAWLFHAYENMREFFHNPSNVPYRVFLRGVGRGGGTASHRSFMGAVDVGTEDSTKQSPRVTVAHEISHFFVGGLSGGPPGASPWYQEGANTLYTRRLLLRKGLMTPDEFLADVNNHARGYYTNPYRRFTADSIRLIGYSTGFGGASAQNLAYSRGNLFWAEADLRIRTKSGGRRNLDDVLVPLIEARERGQRFTQDALFAALDREDPSIRALFDAVITRAEMLVPSSEIFGPCFRRVSVRLPITAPGPATDVDGYVWERVPTVPDAECRKW